MNTNHIILFLKAALHMLDAARQQAVCNMRQQAVRIPFELRRAVHERILVRPLRGELPCNLGCFVRALPTKCMHVRIYKSTHGSTHFCVPCFCACVFSHARCRTPEG